MKYDKKILITGGAGFFGGHICEEALERGYNIVLIDILNSETTPSSYKEKTLNYLHKFNSNNKKSRITSYRCDIKDEKTLTKIFLDEEPTIVIHAASLVMDRASIEIPIDFIQTNVIGTQTLLNACSKINTIKHFVFISSRSAIGEVLTANTNIFEEDSLKPINPYGASKAAAEHLFHSHYHNYNIPVTVCRMNPMYGPRCRHDMFVWRLINSALTGMKIEKYGSGEAIRDWLFVKDAAKAIFLMLSKTSGFEIINLGTGVGTTTNELIEIVKKTTKKALNIDTIDPILGDAHFAGIADCSKAKRIIGWESTTSLEEGISLTYNYMKKELLK